MSHPARVKVGVVKLCVAFCLAMISTTVFTQPAQPTLALRSGLQFRGDLFDGLATGPKISQTGEHYVGLVQSKAHASPPPKEIALVVDGLVNAYLSHHPERYSSFVLPGPILFIHDVGTTPQDFIPKGFPFKFTGKLTANTPYYLRDKANSFASYSVRVEWLVNGQLAFITWLAVSDGKVIGIISDEANPPPLPRAAFDTPEPEQGKSNH